MFRPSLLLAAAVVCACATSSPQQSRPPTVETQKVAATDESTPAQPIERTRPKTARAMTVIVIDLSGSMNFIAEKELAEEGGKAPPTRLDVAERVTLELIRRRSADTIGVVVFGKSAFWLAKPTTDLALVQDQVSEVRLGMVDGSEGQVGRGMALAVAELRRSSLPARKVILLTDGDFPPDTFIVDPVQVAEVAKEAHVQIDVVRVSDLKETEVQAGLDPFGVPLHARVRSETDLELLSDIATETGGRVLTVSDRQSLESALSRLAR